MVMVLVCRSSDVQTFGAAAGLLDRVARFESGVPGHVPCALAVTSVDQTANYRLHVIRSGDQLLTSAALAGFVALTEARAGTYLSDEAGRALTRVTQLLR